MGINHGRTVVGNTMEMGIGVTDIGVTCLFTLMFPFLPSRFFLSTRVCRHNWHSAGSTGWPFSMLKYKYVFQIKRTEAILSNSIYCNIRHTFVRSLSRRLNRLASSRVCVQSTTETGDAVVLGTDLLVCLGSTQLHQLLELFDRAVKRLRSIPGCCSRPVPVSRCHADLQ